MLCFPHKWKHIKDIEFQGSNSGLISVVRCENCGKVKHIKTYYEPISDATENFAKITDVFFGSMTKDNKKE